MNISSRRSFIKNSLATGLAFTGLQRCLAAPESRIISPYGDLLPDPKGILDLPKGFEYQILSQQGTLMDDGLKVPGLPDGMAAFPGKKGRVILVRNHELTMNYKAYGPFPKEYKPSENLISKAYNANSLESISPGGTTNIVYNPKTKRVEKQFLSLIGTDLNCAGGAMPWGAWITCEEPADLISERGRNHGYCFEVKASEDGMLQKAVPLKALGRFCHEAVALDPKSGILYLTEDVGDGLLYRFIPDKANDLSSGKLQALAITDNPHADLRNWDNKKTSLSIGDSAKVKWIDLQDIDAPYNDLRLRGHKAGAAIFARGEGIIYADKHIYICCTNGGPNLQGQIFKLTPGQSEGVDDQLQLFLQPAHSDLLTNGDNICNTPWGDLIICEDLTQPYINNDTFIRGITPEGKIYTIARNAINNGEFAGSCFSPDGQTMFVNIQASGLTLAITGPWQS